MAHKIITQTDFLTGIASGCMFASFVITGVVVLFFICAIGAHAYQSVCHKLTNQKNK